MTSRGKVSSIWITQRLQEIDEAILSQNNANLLGGFGSDRDRGNDDGKMERLNSASIDMTAEHYGGSDQKLRHPFNS